ncbi:hypothetical protein CYY_007044 [Polysphondylium violaceum]|uniref:Carbohydrate binding domain-containing protein n=1 Tax=Polysphondylium violaceum TaxID=133409 RepID=A0A8J4PYA8_9MYCE|nr:hypothetical protein CYY_007044 [Polysphondylium violaceum]
MFAKLALFICLLCCVVGLQGCDVFASLDPLFVEAGQYKCLTVSGVSVDSSTFEQKAYKGFIHFSRYPESMLRHTSPNLINIVSSNSVKCQNGLFQPFLNSNTKTNEFTIFKSNSTLRLDGVDSVLSCINPTTFLASYGSNTLLFNIKVNPIEVGCPVIQFGDQCTNDTTPTSSPTIAPVTTSPATTETPTQSSNNNLTIEIKQTYSWEQSGKTYYNYDVLVGNPNTFNVADFVIQPSSNFSPENIWNCKKNDDGTLSIAPGQSIGSNQKFTFGFTIKYTDFSFSVLSYTKQ